jgi:hypothetical protein
VVVGLERARAEIEERDARVEPVAELLLDRERLGRDLDRRLVVVPLRGDVTDVAEDDRQPAALADRAEAVGRLAEQLARAFEILDGRGDGAQVAVRPGDRVRIPELEGDLEHPLAARAGVVEVACVKGERGGDGDRLPVLACRSRRRCGDRDVEPAPAFAEVPAHVPERPQRTGQAQDQVRRAGFERPAERGPDVVVIGFDAVEHGCRLRARLQLGLGGLGQRDEVLGVPVERGRPVALAESVQGVAAHRLEHGEAPGARLDEAAVDQRPERGEIHVAHALGGLDRASACEDAEPGERLALGLCEQVVAPPDRGRERRLARREVARARAERLGPLLEPLQHRRGREDIDASGREFERKREAVEAAADRRDARGRGLVERERRIDGACTKDEELHRLVLRELVDVRDAGSRQGERLHGVLVLAGDAQGRAARREHPQVRGGGEQITDDRRRGRDLLEVVEHEEQGAVAELLRQRIEQCGARVGDAERSGDSRQEQVRLEHAGEVDEDCSAREDRRQLLGHGEREASLPRPAGADEGDEPGLRAQQRDDRSALETAADERRRRHGQPSRRRPVDRRGRERRVVAEHAPLEVLQHR